MNTLNAEKSQLRQLVKIAIMTSPLIAIYTIMPMMLFISSLPQTEIVEMYISRFSYTVIFKALFWVSVVIFIHWMLNIWLFHLMDHQLKRRIHQYWKYFISYSFMFLVVMIIQKKRAEINPIDFGAFKYYPFIGATANNTFILIMYWLITSRYEKAKLELDKTRLELAQSVTQQEQLKNKIHPHFIFNALNTLKILIKREQKTAEEYLVRLSAYLRFSITETSKDLALIKDEIEFCQNYIELQKIRFANAIVFENDLPNTVQKTAYLPVVTLQSLAENAIKHNAFTSKNILKIQIKQNEDQSISFINNIIPKRNNEATTGTGLDNLKQRFQLLGIDTPTIHKNTLSNQFEVTFKTINK
ncbi:MULTISPECIES: sensor histidine kinase [Flammeovirga]|uniref:Histidine kinase n=1 Tax=Flammeovirga agarivorans TaxID=2726742 RepID=A0A7X8XYR5_9BACT|nr:MULTISPECIES: histidine kinase [Flammeovirga]NLR94474.1 histidine kinase [Flammeovirga agarivorans]